MQRTSRRPIYKYNYDELDRLLMSNDDSTVPPMYKYKTKANTFKDIYNTFMQHVAIPENNTSKMWNLQKRKRQYTFKLPELSPMQRAEVARKKAMLEPPNLVALSRAVGNTYSRQNRVLNVFDRLNRRESQTDSRSSIIERKKVANSMGNYWLKTNFQDPSLIVVTKRSPSDENDLAKERKMKADSYGNFWSRSNAHSRDPDSRNRSSEELLNAVNHSNMRSASTSSTLRMPQTKPKSKSQMQEHLINLVKTPDDDMQASTSGLSMVESKQKYTQVESPPVTVTVSGNVSSLHDLKTPDSTQSNIKFTKDSSSGSDLNTIVESPDTEDENDENVNPNAKTFQPPTMTKPDFSETRKLLDTIKLQVNDDNDTSKIVASVVEDLAKIEKLDRLFAERWGPLLPL